MKTLVRKNFAGLGIRLAVLSVLFLGMARACMAQASAAPAQPAAQAAVAVQAHPVAQTAQTGAPAARGTQEGIKVHGHWTIEVKNPDGKLVTHREFENSLVYNGGALLLPALLSGTAVSGPWQITLADTVAGRNVVFIVEPNSIASSQCPGEVLSVQQNFGGAGSCSNNLALINVVSIGPYGLGPVQPLTLTGTGTILTGFPASIGYVQTMIFICPSVIANVGDVTTQYCFNNAQNYAVFTTRTLDGVGSDPAAVPVSAGQTVAVTIVISFQ